MREPAREQPHAEQPGEHPEQVAHLHEAGQITGPEMAEAQALAVVGREQLQVGVGHHGGQGLAEVGGQGVGTPFVREHAVFVQVGGDQQVLDAVAQHRAVGDVAGAVVGQAGAEQ